MAQRAREYRHREDWITSLTQLVQRRPELAEVGLAPYVTELGA